MRKFVVLVVLSLISIEVVYCQPDSIYVVNEPIIFTYPKPEMV